MKENTKFFIIIVLVCADIGCIEKMLVYPQSNSPVIPILPSDPIITPTPFTTPTETPYPVPNYIPQSSFFNVYKDGDFWYAQNPTSYITPDNEWVKYYASQLFIDTDGRIKYKNIKVITLVDENKFPLVYDYKEFYNNYEFDIYKETYGYVDKNNVPWLMPDFYLYHGNRGVCSAWANTVTSLMLSGEMSLKNPIGDNFVKQIIPAKTIMGYTKNGLRDAWSEYNTYNKTWITSTMEMKIPFTDTTTGGMLWEEKGVSVMRGIYEFTDKYFKKV